MARHKKKLFRGINYLLWDTVLTVGIGLILRFSLDFPFQAVAVEAVLDFAIFWLAFSGFLVFRLWKYRGVISSLLKVDRHEDMQQPTIALIKKNVERLEQIIYSAFSRDGVTLTILEVDLITQLCFSSGRGVYNGTDSHVPSVFKKMYPQYLAYHEENVRKKNQPGIRILLVSENDLRTDFIPNKDDFKSFQRWHTENSIELFQVDPKRAKDLADGFSLESTDLGFWDSDFVILFSPFQGDRGKLRLIIRPRESDEFRNCRNYFVELLEHSKNIEIGNDQLSLGTRRRSEIEADERKVWNQWDN